MNSKTAAAIYGCLIDQMLTPVKACEIQERAVESEVLNGIPAVPCNLEVSERTAPIFLEEPQIIAPHNLEGPQRMILHKLKAPEGKIPHNLEAPERILSRKLEALERIVPHNDFTPMSRRTIPWYC